MAYNPGVAALIIKRIRRTKYGLNEAELQEKLGIELQPLSLTLERLVHQNVIVKVDQLNNRYFMVGKLIHRERMYER